jgi:hypothetical protein
MAKRPYDETVAPKPSAEQTPPLFAKGNGMRGVLALASAFTLSACTGVLETPWFGWGPDYPQPEFGVTALQGTNLPPGEAAFNRVTPAAIDAHAAQVCTQGFQKLREKPLPADYGEFLFARIACNPYELSFAWTWPY